MPNTSVFLEELNKSDISSDEDSDSICDDKEWSMHENDSDETPDGKHFIEARYVMFSPALHIVIEGITLVHD